MSLLTSRLAGLLPPTTAGRLMLVSFFIDPLGTGLFVAGSTVFFTRQIGLSATQVAVGLSISGIVGMAMAVPAGLAADRFGVRRVQIGLHLWRATGLVLYVFAHDFVTFLLIAAMVGVGDRCSPPLNQALVRLSVPESERVRTMAVLRIAKNLAFTIGGTVAVLVLATSSKAGYLSLVLADAGTFLVAAFIVTRLPLLAPDPGPRTVRAPHESRLPALRDRRFVEITVVNGLLTLHNSLLLVALPLYVLHRTDAPAALVGTFFVLNSVLVTLFQLRAGRGVSGVAAAGIALRRSGLWLAAACAVLAIAAAFGPVAASAVLLAGVVLLTIAEMLQAVGGWEVSFALSPPERQAQYLSVFGLGTAIEAVAGPALLTFLLVGHGGVGWAALAVLFGVSGLAAAWLTSTSTRTTSVALQEEGAS